MLRNRAKINPAQMQTVLRRGLTMVKTAEWVDDGGALKKKIHLIMSSQRSVYMSYLMVVVDESRPTAILCSPSLICWAQYGCSHATQDTCPAYTMGMIQFSILNSLKTETHAAIGPTHCLFHRPFFTLQKNEIKSLTTSPLIIIIQ